MVDTEAVVRYHSQPVHSIQFFNVCLLSYCPEWVTGMFLGHQQQMRRARSRVELRVF